MEGKMIVVNVGECGITKVLSGEKGAVREKRFFPPNIPVECSHEMAVGLLKKYNNPTMKIIFRSAEGFALTESEALPIFDTEIGEVAPESAEVEEPVAEKKKRGRPAKK
jgi:hypothetical protein